MIDCFEVGNRADPNTVRLYISLDALQHCHRVQGGGLCELDNLRTLCVACHADVTKAQARERREERAREKLRVKDIRSFMSPSQQQPAATSQLPGAVSGKRRSGSVVPGDGEAKAKRKTVSSSDDGGTKRPRGKKSAASTAAGQDTAQNNTCSRAEQVEVLHLDGGDDGMQDIHDQAAGAAKQRSGLSRPSKPPAGEEPFFAQDNRKAHKPPLPSGENLEVLLQQFKVQKEPAAVRRPKPAAKPSHGSGTGSVSGSRNRAKLPAINLTDDSDTEDSVICIHDDADARASGKCAHAQTASRKREPSATAARNGQGPSEVTSKVLNLNKDEPKQQDGVRSNMKAVDLPSTTQVAEKSTTHRLKALLTDSLIVTDKHTAADPSTYLHAGGDVLHTHNGAHTASGKGIGDVGVGVGAARQPEQAGDIVKSVLGSVDSSSEEPDVEL